MAHRDRSTSAVRLLVATSSIVALFLSPRVHADPPATTQPSLLQQLGNETQQLYLQSHRSVVRVRMPAPQWLRDFNSRQELLNNWSNVISPDVRSKLMSEQERALEALHQYPTTLPTTLPTATSTTQSMTAVSYVPPPGQPSLAIYAVGMLVDDQGHAVFPVFVDRSVIGNAELPAITGEGEATTAKFVGSDAKTNLTVLQLANHKGTPAPLGHRRPEEGALVLAIARDGGAKLVVWTNHHPEGGFAVLTDGSVAGFGFDGQFLGAATAKPIVDQLIATGEVRRAVLGVVTQEVGEDDPVRRQHVELGTSPAIRIVLVQENSAAARGGVCKDDLVLSIGDEPVGDPPTFAAVIATRRGDTTLRVLRGSKVLELTVNMQPK